jgi:cell division protein FtsI/penicillin-binding protein 2
MIRRAAGLLLVLALVLTGAACSPPKDDGKSTAQALAAALTAHKVGSLTFDQPSADVQKELTALSDAITPVWPKVTLGTLGEEKDGVIRASLNYVWTFPNDTSKFDYKTGADLKRSGDGWVVQWTPEMVEPTLKAGETFKLAVTDGKRAGILAADGEAIVKDRPVQVVGINKQGLSDAEAESSAKALAAVLDIDPAAYVAKVKAYGPVAFVEAITLRQEAFDALDQAQLGSIKGFLAEADQLPLAPSRTFASAILGSVQEATAEDIKNSKGAVTAGQMVGVGGLQASMNSELAGTPGITLSIVPAKDATKPADPNAQDPASAGRQVFSLAPTDGKDVKTTLVPKLQTAAEDTLADVKSPSSIVIMRPSTGAILAAANGPDSNGYNTAFLGQYAPGSTFKIATSLGLFRNGMNPTSTVDCSPEYIADGKKFLNATGYDPAALGKITLTTAIAHSCNTAFVSQYQNLSQDKLADAAGALGLGMTNNLGLDAFMGKVPRGDSGTAHAASMIGQGNVVVSPLAMATLMSTVVKGSAVVPQLVAGHDGAAKPADGAKLTTEEAAQLRTMMRAVVTDGYLTTLLDLPGKEAIGKTGTAEYGTKTPPQTHSWVIAAQGDIAVAVFVEDGDLGAVTGGPLAKAALQAAAGS